MLNPPSNLVPHSTSTLDKYLLLKPPMPVVTLDKPKYNVISHREDR
jgi:hypothetical protein